MKRPQDLASREVLNSFFYIFYPLNFFSRLYCPSSSSFLRLDNVPGDDKISVSYVHQARSIAVAPLELKFTRPREPDVYMTSSAIGLHRPWLINSFGLPRPSLRRSRPCHRRFTTLKLDTARRGETSLSRESQRAFRALLTSLLQPPRQTRRERFIAARSSYSRDIFF